MKKLAIVVAVSGILTACGTTNVSRYNDYQKEQYQQQERQAKIAIQEAPPWMVDIPKSPNAVYAAATDSSTDFSMSMMKAKAVAYAQICTAAGGTIRQTTNVYKADKGNATVENSELAIRSMCADVDITGVEVVDRKFVQEGNRIRSYVLVALPIGQSNTMKNSKEAERRAPEAMKELDSFTDGQKNRTNKKADEVSVVNPDGTSGSLTLLPVENEEYKKRRAEALQKPGAVVGQVTIR